MLPCAMHRLPLAHGTCPAGDTDPVVPQAPAGRLSCHRPPARPLVGTPRSALHRQQQLQQRSTGGVIDSADAAAMGVGDLLHDRQP
jgi:hypothetical protein